jgi:uncharacterized protein
MYVVEIRFDSDPARLEARPAHREKLKELRERGVLVMAGPWADDTGALLIFDVESENDVAEVLKADPYYSLPSVTVRSTRQWNPLPLSS